LNRDLLIQQVKGEYARLAGLQSQTHITDQSYSSMSPEAYYEKDLRAANERRGEVIPQMIREMKEQQAQEELNYDSPNVLGGGGNG